MFKINDKKHRKRALMKLQCAPKCTTEEEKDGGDFYNVASSSSTTKTSNGHQVTQKTMEYAYKYNLEDAPSHLTRKSMKLEESSFDEVDNVGTSRISKTYVTERNSSIKSKVLLTLKSPFMNWIKDNINIFYRHNFQVYVRAENCPHAWVV